MKRLVIFVFYDFDNTVDDYVTYLLATIKGLADKLVIVSNSKLNNDLKNIFYKYTNLVYERDNVGYDGGAYKDALLKYLNTNEIKQYDELVLMNDTFYGPFYSWNDMFSKMEKLKNIDFWGITRHTGNIHTLPHIQGYFIVFNNQVLKDSLFWDFWYQFNYPNSYGEAVKNYEIGISQWLIGKGYRTCSYVELFFDNKLQTGCNVAGKYMYELIKDYRCPILKRKAISGLSWLESQKTINFISANTDYDVNLIKCNLNRYEKAGKMLIGFEETRDFCAKYKDIYIYGNGEYAEKMNSFLHYLGVEIKGFLVTKRKNGENAIEYTSDSVQRNEGVIVSVGKRNYQEVINILVNDLDSDQILSLHYDY